MVGLAWRHHVRSHRAFLQTADKSDVEEDATARSSSVAWKMLPPYRVRQMTSDERSNPVTSYNEPYDTETMNQGHGRQIFASFLCGAMTGVALGLLFAPARGRDARSYLANKAGEGRERASKAIDQSRGAFKRQTDRVSSLVSKAQTTLQRESDHAKRVAAEGREALSDIAQRGQRAYENVRTEAREAIRDARGAMAAVEDRGEV
jgi:gas vesicle protein